MFFVIYHNCASSICLHVEIIGGAGEAIAELKKLFSLAEKFGFSEWVQFDASIVRGLAYYTGIVFEVRHFLYLFYMSVALTLM